MPKRTLNLSPLLERLDREAEALGVSLPALLTADLHRYRTLAAAATPELTEWEWLLLGHVLDGIEQLDILGGIDDLPSNARIITAIDEWADHADYDDTTRAGDLRRKVASWSPLEIAGVLHRLRQGP